MKRVFSTMILVAAAFAAVSCANNSKGGSSSAGPMAMGPTGPASVEVATTRYEDVPQTEVYSTNVQAYVVNNVVPQAGSRIKKINVEVGDFVAKDQVLAEMDQANLEQTRLRLENQEIELERLTQLYNEGGLSKSDYEASVVSFNVSKSQYDNLLENTVLRSPISGVITARNYDTGDMYAMSSPIFVVQQITPVKLLVGISETDYTKVKKGDKCIVEADALPGRTFEGKINRIYPTIDATTHTFTAEVIVTNSDRALRPGMYARVTITFAVNHSIIIPDSAVVKMQGAGLKSVFVLNSDSTVTSKVITLGRHFGADEYEVLSGLEEGEKVVTKGHTTLKNGDEVNVIE